MNAFDVIKCTHRLHLFHYERSKSNLWIIDKRSGCLRAKCTQRTNTNRIPRDSLKLLMCLSLYMHTFPFTKVRGRVVWKTSLVNMCVQKSLVFPVREKNLWMKVELTLGGYLTEYLVQIFNGRTVGSSALQRLYYTRLSLSQSRRDHDS